MHRLAQGSAAADAAVAIPSSADPVLRLRKALAGAYHGAAAAGGEEAAAAADDDGGVPALPLHQLQFSLAAPGSALRRLLAGFRVPVDGLKQLLAASAPATAGAGEAVHGVARAAAPGEAAGPARAAAAVATAGEAKPRPVTLLSVFKWEMRKGWDVLLEAYLQVRRRRHALGLT